MKGREIRTTISREKLPNGYNSYFVIINDKREGLSWYGAHLSPENKSPSTLYIVAQELDTDYGNFMGWYIDKILD